MIVDHEGEKAAAAVTLHDVPTQIETYKSHNQVHLVKNGDIGQALVVHELHHVQDPAEQEKLEGILAVLMGMEQHNELPATVQSGLTPPMIRPYGLLPSLGCDERNVVRNVLGLVQYPGVFSGITCSNGNST